MQNPFPERQLAAASYLRREGERIQSYILAQVPGTRALPLLRPHNDEDEGEQEVVFGSER